MEIDIIEQPKKYLPAFHALNRMEIADAWLSTSPLEAEAQMRKAYDFLKEPPRGPDHGQERRLQQWNDAAIQYHNRIPKFRKVGIELPLLEDLIYSA